MAAGEARVEEPRVVVVDHPLVQHKLSLMRSRDTHTAAFRALAREATVLMAYEVTRDLPVTLTTIETPLETMEAPLLDGKKVVLVGILRAGIGMLDGMLEVMPSARVGHIGLYRDPKTLEAVEYYMKLPGNLEDRDLLVVDPMLATANTAVAAVGRLKESSPRSLKLVCLLAAPEGLERFHSAHPDVPVFVGAVDRQLNAKGYILPGLGDAGDRLFGTR